MKIFLQLFGIIMAAFGFGIIMATFGFGIIILISEYGLFRYQSTELETS